MDVPGKRQAAIARAVSRALAASEESKQRETLVETVHHFLSILELRLARFRPADFLALRHNHWHIDEGEYRRSFQTPTTTTTTTTTTAKPGEASPPRQGSLGLVAAGNLGYSGSTFLRTADGNYMVKSVDRRFESQFLLRELFAPYVAHAASHEGSLLIRITDILYAPRASLGSLLGVQPRHYMVMENLLRGRPDVQWQTFDLKPTDYFFPERDLVHQRLVPSDVVDRLADEPPRGVDVSSRAALELTDLVAEDTAFLAHHNAVDYSLLFARSRARGRAVREPPSWRTGVLSSDGNWVYRAVLLDFLWARHKLRAKTMAGLVGVFNLLFDKGPMTITTEPFEYRRRFMSMVTDLLSKDDYVADANSPVKTGAVAKGPKRSSAHNPPTLPPVKV
ncbi:uncharacterized protein UV8b_02772 [Ustilaginoidea virens]|nr:uncharacterized protein UV8b_02772 [Ustilaginoidea virens]QUC18531.1 hypothetical protein UV8b_02772 [Ustilaginoidea virens]